MDGVNILIHEIVVNMCVLSSYEHGVMSCLFYYISLTTSYDKPTATKLNIDR